MADRDDENVDRLMFGSEFSEVRWLPNAVVALICEAVASSKYGKSKQMPPDAFVKARDYARKFSGAFASSGSTFAPLPSAALVDELNVSLSHLEFVRETSDGEIVKHRLHDYQIVALINLNPVSRDVATAVIPSLAAFTEEEMEDILRILKRASAKHG